MEKRILQFILILVLAACSEDNVVLRPEEQNVILSASMEQQVSETKTALASDNSVVWSLGDEISVLSHSAESRNNRFALASGAASTNATFYGSVLSPATKYYALYPYSTSASYDGTDISFSLPDTQTYSANTFGNGANPAVAVFNTSSDVLQFKNICGVLSIYLTGSGSLESITLISKKSGEYLWGDYDLKADAAIGTSSQTLAHTSNGSNTVVLNCGSGVDLSATAKEFDIVLPVGSLSEGFEAICRFTGGETDTISTTKAQTIARSLKHIMTTRNVAAPVSVYVNLENDQVKAFLDYAGPRYVDGDLTVSYVSDYNVSTTYRKDRPFPVSITWENSDNSTAQYLSVSENADFSDAYYDNVEISNSISTYDIYDLIPKKTYFYKVVASDNDSNETLINSSFTTLGRRRMLKIDNTFNVRDLGGIETADGHTIKYGKLFRGGRPNEYNDSTTILVTSDGKQAIKRAGIMVELDLRSHYEAGYLTSSPFNIDGEYTVEYKRFPTATSAQYGNINTSAGVVHIQELQYVIEKLRENEPIYFHCSIGADRTGTLACLIEGLLGVPESQFAIDYELTSFSQAGPRLRGGGSGYFGGEAYSLLYNAIMTVPDDIEGVTYPASVTTSLQRKFYNYYYRGIDGTTISQEDLNWFIDYMLE